MKYIVLLTDRRAMSRAEIRVLDEGDKASKDLDDAAVFADRTKAEKRVKVLWARNQSGAIAEDSPGMRWTPTIVPIEGPIRLPGVPAPARPRPEAAPVVAVSEPEPEVFHVECGRCFRLRESGVDPCPNCGGREFAIKPGPMPANLPEPDPSRMLDPRPSEAEPDHVHSRACYDDPGPGHGPAQIICDQAEAVPDADPLRHVFADDDRKRVRGLTLPQATVFRKLAFRESKGLPCSADWLGCTAKTLGVLARAGLICEVPDQAQGFGPNSTEYHLRAAVRDNLEAVLAILPKTTPKAGVKG